MRKACNGAIRLWRNCVAAVETYVTVTQRPHNYSVGEVSFGSQQERRRHDSAVMLVR